MDFILIVSPLNFWHQNSYVENKYQFFSNIRHIIDGTYFNQSHRTFFLTHLDVYRFFEKNGEEEEGVIDWNFWRVETAKKAFWAVTECENNQGKKHADYLLTSLSQQQRSSSFLLFYCCCLTSMTPPNSHKKFNLINWAFTRVHISDKHNSLSFVSILIK